MANCLVVLASYRSLIIDNPAGMMKTLFLLSFSLFQAWLQPMVLKKIHSDRSVIVEVKSWIFWKFGNFTKLQYFSSKITHGFLLWGHYIGCQFNCCTFARIKFLHVFHLFSHAWSNTVQYRVPYIVNCQYGLLSHLTFTKAALVAHKD